MSKVKLIDEWEAERMREEYAEHGRIFNLDGIGEDPHIVKASGRATCRCCGTKIEKGDDAIVFFYDFHGCGAWTAVECYIHLDECKSEFLETPKEASNCEQIFGVKNYKCSICGGVDGSCGHPEMR
jgi:hypothetical protein